MVGSGKNSICEILRASIVNCGGWSTGAEAEVTTASENAGVVGTKEASGVDMVFVDSTGEAMPDVAPDMSSLLPLIMSSPFPPLFLLFGGGGGFTVRFDGDNAPLARKITSLHRLQSSSSSFERSCTDVIDSCLEQLFQEKNTFIPRSLVITSTASFDKGTGDPIPMSSPVSRGSNLGIFPIEPV